MDVLGSVGGAGSPIVRPVTAVDVVGHAGSVVAHRPIERVVFFEEVRPIASEAGAWLDDGDGTGMHAVGPIQGLVGGHAVGTKVEQRETLWTMVFAKLGQRSNTIQVAKGRLLAK